MTVDVRLYATLAIHAPTGRAGEPFDVDIVEPATLAALIETLGLPEHDVHLAIVNGRVAHARSIVLKPGDRVGLFPPGGGG